MTPEEIIELVESTAFYQEPEASHIVYVNLKRLKEALTEKLPLDNVSDNEVAVCDCSELPPAKQVVFQEPINTRNYERRTETLSSYS